LDLTRSNYASVDYGDFRVVTNVGPVQPVGQVQEFLIRMPSSGAPESTTQLLLGFVLVGASCLSRRFRTVL
jgi:hypothetical protein